MYSYTIKAKKRDRVLVRKASQGRLEVFSHRSVARAPSYRDSLESCSAREPSSQL
jgi:predicted nucleotidyltransferase